MKKLLVLSFLALLSSTVAAQQTEKVWRINAINPGIEYEHPLSTRFTLSIEAGIGYSGSYPNLTTTTFGTGWNYVIAPFADLQLKRFYNFDKRLNKNKTIANNSGNFVSMRFWIRGKSIDDNIARKANYDFAVGPTWGIQRKYGRFHLLLDIGPQFYFDSEGNSGFWPIMPQINIGVDL